MASPEEPLIVTWGEERRFLQPMPVELLPISEGTKRMLRLLGLDTLGQIASLPVDAVITQFGQEGFLAHRLASGMDERPLMPRARPAILEDELTVDDALQTAEPLVVAIGLLLARLLSKLRAHNRVCGQVRLRLELDDGAAWCDSFTLKSPSNSEGEIMMLLKHRLETAHFPAGVTNISLVLCDLSSERGTQSPLLQSDRVRQEAQLKHAVKRLKVRFGRNPLKRAVSLDPQSRIPERRAGLIEFEP
jgi:nucleotidyltransferase/DNA polymerase involved in DNA repair